MEDEHYGGVSGEEVYKRTITITGQVENTWIKSPRRFIEGLVVAEKTKHGYQGGITILSNEDSPAFLNKENEAWLTKSKSENEDDEDED